MAYTTAINNALARSNKVHSAFIAQIPNDSQGEKLFRWLKRAKRDLIQRECARRRARIMQKSRPRVDREADIKQARDAKQSYSRDYLVEEQSGIGIRGVALAAGATATIGGGVFHLTRKLVRGVVGKLQGVVDDATKQLNESEAVKKVETMISSATRATDAVSGTFEPLAGLFQGIQSVVQSIVDIVKTIGGAFWKLAIGAFVIAIRALASIHEAIKDFIVSIISRLVPDMAPVLDFEDMTMQQDGGLVSKICAMVACFVSPKGDNPMQVFMTIMGRVGNFTRVSSGIEGVFNTTMMILEKCLNCILSIFGSKGVRLVGAAARQVMDWSKDCDEVFKKIDTENPTIADLNHAKALLVTGYNIKNTIQAPYLRDAIGRTLDKLNARLAAHRGLLEIENTYRQQPTLCMFGGDSAVGKTFLIKNFASACLVLSGLCKPSECAQNMWQKGEDRFFNGYCGQLVYIMDDVFQKKSVKGSDECEGMTIIRAVNSWPFPLPFADVESKGRYFFNSKLMVGTTNQHNIKTDLESVLAQPEAVLRRITHGYWLTVTPEFGIPVGQGDQTTYRLDYQKWERVRDARVAELQARGNFTSDELLAAVPWEAWRLKQCRFDGSQSQGDGPSVFALVKQVAAELKAGAERHDSSVKQLNSWLGMFESVSDARPPTQPASTSSASGVVAQSGVDRPLIDSDESLSIDDEGRHFYRFDSKAMLQRYRTSLSLDMESLEDWPSDSNSSSTPRPRLTRPERSPDIDPDAPRERLVRQSDPHPPFLQALYDANNEELAWRHRVLAHMKYTILGLAEPTHRYDAFMQLLAWAGTLAVGVRVLFKIGKAVKALFKTLWGLIFPDKDEEEDKGEITEQSVHKEFSPKVFPTKGKKGGTVSNPSAVAQLGNPPQNILNDIVYRNTWKIISDGKVVGQVLFLRGTIGVMPWHFRKDLTESGRIEMISCGSAGMRVSFTGKEFASYQEVSFEKADLTFVDFSKVCTRAHRDVVKYCVLDRDVVKELSGTNDIAVRLDVARTHTFNGAMEVERVTLISNGLRFDPQLSVGLRDVTNAWAYGMPTECGDCGAPLTIAEARYFGGKAILGLHIAGRTRTPGNGGQREGWSAVITQELVKAALSKFKGVIKDNFVESMEARGIKVDENLADVVEESGLAKGSMMPIGMVPEDKVVSQSVRSKIRSTGFDGFGPCPVAPAHLAPVVKNGEIVEPMHVAMANYQSNLHVSQIPNADAIMALAMKKHTELTENSTRRILDFNDAVLGVSHMKLKSINRASSAGYPYNLEYTKGKKDIFGEGDEFDMTRPEVAKLKEDVLRVVDSAKRGEREAHVFVDFLKDETRPLAKVDAVATRAISGAPLDYIIACRMYFGAFMSSIYTNHTVCGMAPGVNYYTEWDLLAISLLKPGGRVFAGDFKAFDASEQPDIFALCLKHINNWYGRFGVSEEDNLVRAVLFEDLVHSRHLTGIGCIRDCLVQWNKSLPSGHPLTTIMNSMYSLFALTACYVIATGDYTNMWDQVFICTYGDDNVVGVSDAVSEVFNQVTVAELMAKHFRLTYTSDKKGAALVPYETIKDITFLKRGFVRAECDGGWAAPLALDSILFRTYFYKSERTFTRDQAQNFSDAMMELSLHPEELWAQYFHAAAEYCARQRIPLPIVSRDQARQMCFARTDVWF